MPQPSPSSGSRSIVVRHARPVPVGTGMPRGQAYLDRPVDLRVTDGTVTEVGPGLQLQRTDDLVDADGRFALPGLWDHHVHLTSWARSRAMLDLTGTTGPEDVTRRVREHLDRSPARPRLVSGFGYRSAPWSRVGTVAELDAASGDVPVVLTAGDGHNGWLNSAALRLLGLGGVTGPLTENEWFTLQPAIAGLSDELERGADRNTALEAALREAAARGVTGIVDLEMPASYSQWPERFVAGLGLLRVRGSVYPSGLDDLLAAGIRTGDLLAPPSELLTMGPLKIISDGSLNTRTAACYEPYADSEGLDYPSGRQNYDLNELIHLLSRASAGGLDVALHAIGDLAVDVALCAFEATGAEGSIEHAQLLRREDIPRMARLGVRASVQPAHLLDDRDVTLQCWPDRADRCFPLRSLVQAGVELALGSDAPVAPLDPWLAMAAAVHRSADERDPWNPSESLTAEQAVAASTNGQGTVQVGSRGDLVLLDANPLASAADTAEAAGRLREMTVAATIVGGRPVYSAL